MVLGESAMLQVFGVGTAVADEHRSTGVPLVVVLDITERGLVLGEVGTFQTHGGRIACVDRSTMKHRGCRTATESGGSVVFVDRAGTGEITTRHVDGSTLSSTLPG